MDLRLDIGRSPSFNATRRHTTASVFPHLRQGDPGLAPLIARLTDEHLIIHDAIEAVDRALVGHITHPDDGFAGISSAMDFLADSLLSHLAYEE